MARPLFIAGCQRSGTTAFADYLNQHREVLLCRERYKYVPEEITVDHLTFERILDYREGETNVPREYHVELLGSKDPAKLKWIGDKNPDYFRRFESLQKHNPGAHFIVLYRPVEEVAESFEARASDARDHWPSHLDFEKGVRRWNLALRKTRDFVESSSDPRVLIVSYHDFFYQSDPCVSLISRFLGLEFDESMRKAWREMSLRFEKERRRKKPISGGWATFIQENKDHGIEEWVLDRIDKQRSEPELYVGERADTVLTPQNSRIRKLSKKLGQIKARAFGKPRRA